MTHKTGPSPFLIDLHVHTRTHSLCSRVDPFEIPAKAQSAGLSAVVLTEHGYRWTESELDDLRRSAGDLVILAGAEITTPQGDLVVIGTGGIDELDSLASAGDVLTAVRARHGFAIWAHPFRFGEPADTYAREFPPDAMEVASSNMTPDMTAPARRLVRELGVLAVTTSDAHRIDAVGSHPFALPRPVASERELVNCLREMAG